VLIHRTSISASKLFVVLRVSSEHFLSYFRMPSEKKKSRKRKTMVTQEETCQNDIQLLTSHEVMFKFL